MGRYEARFSRWVGAGWRNVVERGRILPRRLAGFVRLRGQADRPVNGGELESLERAIARVIRPMTPRAHFRRTLKEALLAEHRKQRALDDSPRPPAPSWYRTWRLAATVPVVLGLLALLWLRRQTEAPSPLEANT